MCTAFCTQARQPVLWVAASKVVCMGYYRHRNSQGGPRCGYPALGLCSVQQAGQAHPARWPVQVRLPQGACRRQGQRGPEEGAPAGDLWALDRHGHRPHPREEDVLRRDIFDRPPIFKWTQVPPGGRRARRWRMLTAVPVWWGGFVRLEKTGACVSKRLRAERGFCFRVMATLLVWQLDGVGAGWHRRKGKRERLLWAVLGLALRLLCSKPYGRPLERLPNDHAAAGPRGAAGRLGARDAAQPGPGRLHGHRGRLPAGHRPGRRGPGRAAPQRAPGHGARAAELPGALRARRAGRELRRDVVLACFWGHAVRVCPRRHGVW